MEKKVVVSQGRRRGVVVIFVMLGRVLVVVGDGIEIEIERES